MLLLDLPMSNLVHFGQDDETPHVGNRIMTKKQTAAVVSRKLQPKTPVVPIEIETSTDASIKEEMPRLAVFTDEELDQLISDAEASSASDITTQLCKATHELVVALQSRNTRNRYLQTGWMSELKRRFLTPQSDDRGLPIKGTSLWDYSLPPTIYIDDDSSMHNGQHTLEAWLQARNEIRQNQTDVLDGKSPKFDLVKDVGISLETLDQLHLLLVRGISASAADQIDTAKQRTPSDVLYRRNLFSDEDYSLMVDENSSPTLKQISSWQNTENRLLAQVLRFLNYRFTCNGASPRGSTSKFESAAAVQGVSDYPSSINSVHRVWLMLASQKKAGAAALKASGIPLGYLMTSHFLATMSDAKKSKSGGWEFSDESLLRADEFAETMIYGGDLLKGHKLATSIKAACMADEAEINATGHQPAHFFAKDNRGLTAKFHALGWAWRDIMGLEIDPKLITIQTVCSGAAGFARYTDAPAGKSFDLVPERPMPDVETVRASAKVTDAVPPHRPTLPAVRRAAK